MKEDGDLQLLHEEVLTHLLLPWKDPRKTIQEPWWKVRHRQLEKTNTFQFYAQVYPTAAHFSEQFNRWQKQKTISKDAALFPTALLLVSPTMAGLPADCTDNIPGIAGLVKLNMGNALSLLWLQFGARQRGEKGFFLYLRRIINSVEAVFYCFAVSIFTSALTQSNFFTVPTLYTIKHKSWPLETSFYRREKQFSLHNISVSSLSWKGCQLCWIMYKINARCSLPKMGWH